MKPLYFKGLDTLRFFAFFLVFWQHGFSDSFSNLTSNELVNKIIVSLTITGGAGVQIFFVISGFLITFLMIKEEKTKGYVNLKFFYLRRIFRIWPLYYLVLITGIFILPNIFNTFQFSGSIIKNLLFLNNFDMHNQALQTGIAWSVAIEEQFYLFWPVLFIVFRNKKLLSFICIVLFVISTVYIISTDFETSYYNTFGNINYLMTGCFGAIIYSSQKKRISSSRFLKSNAFYCVIVFAFLLTISPAFYAPFYTLALLLLPLTYLYFVIFLVDKGNNKPASIFSTFGKYTYGMYLYHPIIIIFTKMAFDVFAFNYSENRYINFIVAIISLTVTIAVAYISYKYFEKRILDLKNKISVVKTRI